MEWTILQVKKAGTFLLFLAIIALPGTVNAQPADASLPLGSDHAVDWMDGILHWAVRGTEIAGIATIILGASAATVIYLYRLFATGPADAAYHEFRATLGRSILLGLEFLVAADIINTVAIAPTLQSVSVLAAIVVVRTFLSLALDVEINRKWPWKQDRS